MLKIIRRILSHASSPTSHHRRIAVGAAWLALFLTLGKLLGAAKEMAVAWRYGVSNTVDAYTFIFNTISWPTSVWLSILSAVYIPLIIRLKSEDASAVSEFLREAFGLAILIGTALGALAWLGINAISAPNTFASISIEVSRNLKAAPFLSLMATLGVITGFLSVLTIAYGHHRNTLMDAIPSTTILLVLLLPMSVLPDPLVWGTIAGLCVQLLFLAWPLSKVGALTTPRFSFQSPVWLEVKQGFGILLLGQLMSSLTVVVDQIYGAHLGEGAISTMGYSNRVLALILGLGAITISRATLPIFSDNKAISNKELVKIGKQWATLMLVFGLFVLAVGYFASHTIIQILFERGAFKAEDTSTVSRLLEISLIQVPFYFFSLVLLSALAAKGEYKAIAISGGMNLITKLTANHFLAASHGISGLALSTVAMYVVSAAYLYYATERMGRRFQNN